MADKNNRRAGGAILRFIQGILLGASGILPGVSGGVLCVVFGIYKPLMEVLASPLKKIKEHFKMLLPIGAGALLGFLLIVNVLGEVMDNYKNLAECLFVGLIMGTFPSLFRSAGEKKRTAASYIALVASFILIFSIFMYLEYFLAFSVTPSAFWFAGAGVIFGISIVLPGLSAYTVLEFFGIFEPLLKGTRELDMAVLLPVGIGGAAALILLSKLINLLYEKHFSVMSHIIIGIVAATTIPLIPTSFIDVADFAIQLVLMICGFIVATVFSHFETKLEK